MTLALDFGSAKIKAILIADEPDSGRFFSFSLGFRTPGLSRFNLLSAIRAVELLGDVKLLEGEKTLTKLYACVGLPVYENSSLSSAPIILTSEALSSLVINVLDVGSQFVYLQERVSAAPFSAEEVLNWLPFKAEIGEVGSYIENKKIYSSVLPSSPRDLFLEQAIARVRVADFFKSQKINIDFPEIYLSGAVFSKVPYPEQAVLMVLDSLQPLRPMKIFLDRVGILPAAGLVKLYSPQEYERLSDQFTPIFLGEVLPLTGQCRVKIDSGMGEPQTVSLKSGDLYCFPLSPGETAHVTVAKTSDREGEQIFEVTGGLVGLVLDLRQRPLRIPESDSARQDLLKSWDKAMGASGQVEKI